MDKSILLREFFCGEQYVFQKASKFFSHKFKIKNNLDLDMTFEKLIDINLSPFRVSIQDFIEIREPKNSTELYQLLLKYEWLKIRYPRRFRET